MFSDVVMEVGKKYGLDTGDQVVKVGQEGDWIQIDYDGETGYVYSGLLQ